MGSVRQQQPISVKSRGILFMPAEFCATQGPFCNGEAPGALLAKHGSKAPADKQKRIPAS